MKKILLGLLVFFFLPGLSHSLFLGNDDLFNTTFEQSATDNLCIVTFTGDFEDHNSLGNQTDNVGSFDHPDDENTTRTPFKLHYSVTIPALTCLGGGNSARIRIFETESCAGGTIVDQTFLNQVTDVNFNQSTGWDGFLGTHCVRLDVTANDGIGGFASTNDQTGRIGIAPYLRNTNAINLSNMFYNQSLNHSLSVSEGTDIENLIYRLINQSNKAALGFGGAATRTDTTPDTVDIRQMINFLTNPTFINSNATVAFQYLTWTDEGTGHNRFSTNSTNTNSSGHIPQTNWTMSNLIQCAARDSVLNGSLTDDDGITYYNRGESADKSGRILNATGQNFTIQSGVTFDLFWQNETNVTQFSSTGWDIIAGLWDRTTTIPATATAAFAVSPNDAHDYDANLTVDADSDVNELSTCKYHDAIEVSQALQISNDSASINNGINISKNLTNRGVNNSVGLFISRARGTLIGEQTNIFTVWIKDKIADSIEIKITGEDTDSASVLNASFIHGPNNLTDGLAADTRRKFISICDTSTNCITFDEGATNGTGISHNLSERLDLQDVNNFGQVNGTPKRYNRGEAALWNTTILLADNSPHIGSSNVNVFYVDNASAIQGIDNGETITSSGFIESEFNIEPTDTADINPFGTPYRIRLIDGFNNTLSFDEGATNGTDLGVFNVTRFLLLNGQCQDSSIRQDPQINYPDENNTFHDTDYIIGESTATCWGNVRGARNNSIEGATVQFQTFNPDGTLVDTNTLNSGIDGWTSALSVNPQAPSGEWEIYYNVTGFNGNVGGEIDILNFISAFTANLFMTGSFKVISGHEKNVFTEDNELKLIVHTGKIENNASDKPVVRLLQDTDNNETFVTIAMENGTETCINRSQLTRASIGIYEINFTLSQACGFQTDESYILTLSANSDSRTITGENDFTITIPQEESDPKESQCSQSVQENEDISCILELSYLNATPLSGQSPTINITRPDGTTIQTTMNELDSFGIYQHSFQATQTGQYLVRMNNTLDSINFASAQFVNVNDGGHLTADQNSTLYGIDTTINSDIWKDSLAARFFAWIMTGGLSFQAFIEEMAGNLTSHNSQMTQEHEDLNMTIINSTMNLSFDLPPQIAIAPRPRCFGLC